MSNERSLLARLTTRLPSAAPHVRVGIGDDCAVTEGRPAWLRLCTTDLLVEDVHFRRQDIRPETLGKKSLAVNLSDIAAMGGLPLDA
ncbi:MAG: thiamine-phosphate kinase, partial [Deltaproteobacteria bacterium]|nr:thiamine-phosphate kinase [Deltaproteobacteria bacterium]